MNRASSNIVEGRSLKLIEQEKGGRTNLGDEAIKRNQKS